MKIDFHVNLLPDFARRDVSAAIIPDESDHLKHCFNLPVTSHLNKMCSHDFLVDEMDKCGVDQSIVFSYQWKNPDRCRVANSYIVEAVSQNPGRLLGMVVTQPRDPASLQEMEALLSQPGIIGVKMKPRWGGFALSDIEVMAPICEILISKKKLLLTHVTQNFHFPTGDQMHNLIHLMRNFPKLKIVGAHLAGFIGAYEDYRPISKLFENLYIDISLPDNLRWVPHLMRNGDPSKYLYATDWPYTSFTDFDCRLEKSGLTDKELDLLVSKNPRQLLERIER